MWLLEAETRSEQWELLVGFQPFSTVGFEPLLGWLATLVQIPLH